MRTRGHAWGCIAALAIGCVARSASAEDQAAPVEKAEVERAPEPSTPATSQEPQVPSEYGLLVELGARVQSGLTPGSLGVGSTVIVLLPPHRSWGVLALGTFSGKHIGPWGPLKPTNKTFESHFLDIARIGKDDKVERVWTYANNFELLKHLGYR